MHTTSLSLLFLFHNKNNTKIHIAQKALSLSDFQTRDKADNYIKPTSHISLYVFLQITTDVETPYNMISRPLTIIRTPAFCIPGPDRSLLMLENTMIRFPPCSGLRSTRTNIPTPMSAAPAICRRRPVYRVNRQGK